MPAVPRHHQHGIGGVEVGAALQHAHGRLEGVGLHRLAGDVQGVELGGQLGGFERVVGGEQARAEVGAADPAPGVDARSEHEAGVEGRRLALRAPGGCEQRLQPRIGPAGHDLQPLGGQRAVEAGERGHVADCTERGQIEPLAKIGLRPRLEQAAPPRLPVQRRQQHEGDARRRQHPLARAAVGPVGVDQGCGRRRIAGAHQVMVDDHDRQPHPGGGLQRVAGRGPAVDGHHQLRALRLQAAEGGGARAIALGHPVRNVDGELAPHRAEPAHQQGRAGGAVHVVVGEHAARPPVGHRVDQKARRPVHVGEARRVREQRLQGRLEVGRRCRLVHAAGGERAGQRLLETQALLVGAHERRLGRALAPDAAGQGALHAEEGQRGEAVGHQAKALRAGRMATTRLGISAV